MRIAKSVMNNVVAIVYCNRGILNLDFKEVLGYVWRRMWERKRKLNSLHIMLLNWKFSQFSS